MRELEGLLIEKKQQQQQLMHLTGDVGGEFTEFAAATANEVNIAGKNEQVEKSRQEFWGKKDKSSALLYREVTSQLLALSVHSERA